MNSALSNQIPLGSKFNSLVNKGGKRNDLFGSFNQPNQPVTKKRLRENEQEDRTVKRSCGLENRMNVKITGDPVSSRRPLSPAKTNVPFSNSMQNSVVKKQLFIENEENHFSTNIQTLKRGAKSIEDSRSLKRPRLEQAATETKMEIEEDVQNLWLPYELWENVTCFLSLQDCRNFALVSKDKANFVYTYVLPSSFWIERMSEEYQQSVLAANSVQAECVLKLLDRSIKQVATEESKEFFPSVINLKLNTINALKIAITAYDDTEDFLLNLFLGSMKQVLLTPDERNQHLSLARNLCEMNNVDYSLCHARKITEYFIRLEFTKKLHKQSVTLLFTGLSHAMRTDDIQEKKKWLMLLDTSFDELNFIEQDTWFYSCLSILKKDFNPHNIEEDKKTIIQIIRKYLPIFWRGKRTFVFQELKNLLRSKLLSKANKIEIIALLPVSIR